MSKYDIWSKMATSSEYRAAFVGAYLRRGIAIQIRDLVNGMTQQELADKAQTTQATISRATDPNYGNLTINTIIKIAAGADVAFLGRFVPFSEFVKHLESLKETGSPIHIPSFTEESK